MSQPREGNTGELLLTFDVADDGDPDSGLRPYADRVTVRVESGDPGGDYGEFEAFVRDALTEWFDGARVTPTDSAVARAARQQATYERVLRDTDRRDG